jgi:uncharacterized membrane protein YecN with MAPEG domain
VSIVSACAALLGLLLFGLGAAITIQRRRSRIYFGHSVDPTDRLYRLVRAHGNTAEYAPLLCLIMLLAAQRDTASWIVVVSATVTASRYSQVIGMLVGPSLDSPPNGFRVLGTLGTYLGGAALCLAILCSL